MFLFKVKRPIWSALEIEFFELYFLQPVLGGHRQMRERNEWLVMNCKGPWEG